MIHYQHEQGSPEWLAARRGVITGSRFKDARSKLKNGKPSAESEAYCMDLAREMVGGISPSKFQSRAMSEGREQEAKARAAYQISTGNLVEEVGFFTDEKGFFGVSPDGLIDDDGVLEIKTMVSSQTLFKAVANEDVSEYIDQCLGYLWILDRKWVDLFLWVPDLQELSTIIRFEKTAFQNQIDELEHDLIQFASRVIEKANELTNALEKRAKNEQKKKEQ